MLRIILLLLVVAGIAGYFTKPEEPAMRAAADAVLQDPQTISEGFESLGASLAGNRTYDNYFVASRYTISLDGQPVVNCWGAFTQTQCSRAPDTRTGG
ncbi:MAG: hypothetical protein R3C25_04355 [Hyphomonadaceae bacterium]